MDNIIIPITIPFSIAKTVAFWLILLEPIISLDSFTVGTFISYCNDINCRYTFYKFIFSELKWKEAKGPGTDVYYVQRISKSFHQSTNIYKAKNYFSITIDIMSKTSFIIHFDDCEFIT